MRQQKELALLSQSAPHVQFPKPQDQSFINFRAKLRLVLEANNMYNAARGLKWDEDGQSFYWEEDQSSRLCGMRVQVTITYEILPMLEGHSIQEQLEAIIEKRKQMATECFRLSQLDGEENENA